MRNSSKPNCRNSRAFPAGASSRAAESRGFGIPHADAGASGDVCFMIKTYETADGPLRVLFVMAAEAEYGAALRTLVEPLVTGVGPVEAAAHTAQALAREPADLVINLGSAGSCTLPQAEIFQVSALSYRDMDASPLGF